MTATETLAVATLLSFVALPGLSRDNHGEEDNDRQIYHSPHDKVPEIETYHSKHEVSAPEIDPGQVVGALALLGGTLAIIHGYRRKK